VSNNGGGGGGGVMGGQLMSGMSAGQLAVLHRLAMLRVTATLEKHSPSHRTGRSWSESQQASNSTLQTRCFFADETQPKVSKQ